MDKRISRPMTLTFHFDVEGMTEADVQKFRSNLVWHLRGQMETSMRALEFDTEIWREIDRAADHEPVCADADERIAPLDSGVRWACQRVKGHDDPDENGGHSRGWLLRTE